MAEAVRPRTVHTYDGNLRTFFRWVVAEGELPVSPMERLRPPIARADQIQPFTEQQVGARSGGSQVPLSPPQRGDPSLPARHRCPCLRILRPADAGREPPGTALHRYRKEEQAPNALFELSYGPLRVGLSARYAKKRGRSALHEREQRPWSQASHPLGTAPTHRAVG